MKKQALFCAIVVTALSLGSLSWARQDGEDETVENASQISMKVDDGKHWYGHPTPLLGIKSYNDNGRADDYSNPSGRIFKTKNEMFLGVRSEAGWGIFGQIVETGYNFENTTGNKIVPNDPSVTITHPVMDNGIVKINGQFREYFPVSDFSANRKLYEQAYYSNLFWKLPRRLDFFNTLIPRLYSQQFYIDQGSAGSKHDVTFYTEDYTTVSKSVSRSVRVGLGQHTQVEVHPASATGVTVEGYPFADILVTPTVFLGPRIYFPLVVKDYVFDAPSKVTAGQIQAELYLQATL